MQGGDRLSQRRRTSRTSKRESLPTTQQAGLFQQSLAEFFEVFVMRPDVLPQPLNHFFDKFGVF